MNIQFRSAGRRHLSKPEKHISRPYLQADQTDPLDTRDNPKAFQRNGPDPVAQVVRVPLPDDTDLELGSESKIAALIQEALDAAREMPVPAERVRELVELTERLVWRSS